MDKISLNKKLTGVSVPLGALYTKDNPVIGEFPDLIPFADFCKDAGLSIIQLLPINDTGAQSSPYSGLSAFALHPMYIRIKDISVFKEVYENDSKFKKSYDNFFEKYSYTLRYDYDGIVIEKIRLLLKLYEYTEAGKTGKPDTELAKWIKANPWVINYSVYKNLKWNYMQASWKSWHENDQHKTQAEINKLWETKAFKKEHLFYAWLQQIAEIQFSNAVKHIKSCGILLKGDMPILMNEDSCDAWAFPKYFNQDLRAGAPADGENPNGQNWGFPTYNWKNLKTDDFKWWKDRLINAAKYYDAYRLDHILGFFRIWAIPENDFDALNGHTEPYAFIKKEELYELGFDDDRIRWLSLPHIPTKIIEDITWNHDKAVQILKLFCDRIGNEELWLFNSKIKGPKTISQTDLLELCEEQAIPRVKEALIKYWPNRTLIEVQKNKFVPSWIYSQSTSWGTLDDNEKENLSELFSNLNSKNEKLWKKQADEIFTAITSEIKMIPCGEDLGVGIECVPKTMKAHNILGLHVVRWTRHWSEPNQPYVDFEDYRPLSVTTTSVHDSSTIRQWYEEIQNSEFKMGGESLPLAPDTEASFAPPSSGDTPQRPVFSPDVAYTILKNCSKSASIWYINPLQDYLYMNKEYWLPTAEEERINIPGTVTKFNWTYRIPVSLEDLSADNELIEKINDISKRR